MKRSKCSACVLTDVLGCEKCFFSCSRYSFVIRHHFRNKDGSYSTLAYLFMEEVKGHPVYSGLLSVDPEFKNVPEHTLEEALLAMYRSQRWETKNRKLIGQYGFMGTTWDLVGVTPRGIIYMGKEGNK